MQWTGAAFGQRDDVIHGFTGRSDRLGRDLDIGSGAMPAAWMRAAREIGAPGWPVAWVQQVHGADTLVALSPGGQGAGDALVTEQPGLLLAIRTADCVPIALAGCGMVGAIHAGWRGLAAGVVQSTLRHFAGHGPVAAVVGPSICVRCYEVGDDVVAGLERWAKPSVFVSQAQGASRVGSRPHVDLGLLAAHLLSEAGVSVERIDVCTRCGDGLHSHRRHGERAGRQAVLVGLR